MDEFSKYSKEEWRKEFNNEYKMMKKFHVDNDGKNYLLFGRRV